LVNPIKLNILAREYVKKNGKEINKDIVTKFCDGEIQLEKMKLESL